MIKEIIPGEFYCDPMDIETVQKVEPYKSMYRDQPDDPGGVRITGRTMHGGGLSGSSPTPKFVHISRTATVEQVMANVKCERVDWNLREEYERLRAEREDLTKFVVTTFPHLTSMSGTMEAVKQLLTEYAQALKDGAELVGDGSGETLPPSNEVVTALRTGQPIPSSNDPRLIPEAQQALSEMIGEEKYGRPRDDDDGVPF